MKKYLLVLVLATPFLMGAQGCSAIKSPLTGQAVSENAPSTFQQAEKALTIAHLAYNTLGTQLITAAKAGLLKGEDAATAKVYYNKAGDALKLADNAAKLGNETNLLAAINQANAAIADAQTLIGGK